MLSEMLLLYCYVSWSQQDMMPVYHAQNSGSYTSAVADVEYDLVFTGYKPTNRR